MSSNTVLELFELVKIQRQGEGHSLYKPLLLLCTLSKCFLDHPRLISFLQFENSLSVICNKYFKDLKYRNFHYAFGRLENDGIWEIQNSNKLKRSSSGDLEKSELIKNNIHGGFTEEIYEYLNKNKPLLVKIAHKLLHSYFAEDLHAALLTVLSLNENDSPLVLKIAETNAYNGYQPLNPPNDDAAKKIMVTNQNSYIAYLNSLHSLSANSGNALAESQATNRYFAELYQPFPFVDQVLSAVQTGERVVILTGHAGDGKSTIALDVLKRLKNLSATEPLNEVLKEREEISGLASGTVTIVKDMSELSAQMRLQWLQEAFSGIGSWLLVSNSGPLLDTLGKLYQEQQEHFSEWENKVLALLDTPFTGELNDHLLVNPFGKDMLIFNLTRLDNLDLAARVLGKMLNHTAWADCTACSAKAECPLQLNRRALLETGSAIQDRVRWVYQRLSQYEQRLTFRQMVAHLALSITGGMSCNEARKQIDSSTAGGLEKGVEGLAQILFSESFFGYRNGKPWPEAERLRAVALARRLVVGGPMAVDYDRQLCNQNGVDWADLPEDIKLLGKRWQKNAISANAVRWRFALRRMLFVFGLPKGVEAKFERITDNFLQSPRLRDFDRWQREQRLTLSESETNKLLKSCLRVLLECYSGFSADQFKHPDRLYLTLRRTDRDIAQPTQWVIASIPFDAFQLVFDKTHGLLYLKQRSGEAALRLGLPLLDYIQNRDAGELGGKLARIHWAQLEAFRAEILASTNLNSKIGAISLLRAKINGQVELHQYLIDPSNNTLEIYE